LRRMVPSGSYQLSVISFNSELTTVD
jgi:hypothetical protein